ncbi:hypothetical protein J3R30DRAFT_3294262 [Lentinula aciculospora]|uniref:Elongation factor methyltransferase 7 n=1 Tax=Lentinula aciculospora TaxID=153920 RepID=A0A9W9A6A6_9AGAR|nr:hypothetical protein J3R30DRAFT_3294262 [Lentinula aciculospora]
MNDVFIEHNSLEDCEELGLGLDLVFTETPRPPSPEATFSTFQGLHKDFRIKLVGSHPLWGHHLWNSALSVAAYMEQHPNLFVDKNILELGAGGALPSLVAVEYGARKVLITDYPDPDLIQNIEHNVRENIDVNRKDNVAVKGYIWGQSVHPLLGFLQNNSISQNSTPADERDTFDLVILSDLIFNHSQHEALLKTCDLALKSSPASTCSAASAPSETLHHIIFYTHHRPHLAYRDMEFFEKAKEHGWDSAITQKFAPMFPEDPGEEEVRATVHGWILTRRLISG